MSNKYFKANNYPSPRIPILSGDLRIILSRLERAFDFIPSPTSGGQPGFEGGSYLDPTMYNVTIKSGSVGTTTGSVSVFASQLSLASVNPTGSTAALLYANRGTEPSPDFRVQFRTTNLTRMEIAQNGDVLIGDGSTVLAANATAGFLNIPKIGGAPTGTPADYASCVALAYETGANKLWIHNGAWRSVTLA